MKKVFRTITSAILIAIIALSSTAAAFATGGSIEWTDTEFETTRLYTYGGEELDLGVTTIRNNNSEENLVYFDFEAENTGYYLIDTENDSWVKLPESISGGKAYNYLESEYLNDDEQKIFRIEKGETVIGINFYDNSDDKIEIEYLGEEVVDFTIEEDALKGYILGWDIDECDSEYFWVETDTVITFSSDKILSLEDYYFEGVNEDNPEEGENKATVTFLNKSKKVTYTAYEVESIIASAEITNVEDYLTAKENYKGFLNTEYVDGETLTVYFTDGTKYVTEVYGGYADVVLPEGKRVSAFVGEHWNEYDEVFFAIQVAGSVITEYEYTEERKTLGENFADLYEDNENMLYWAKNDFINGIKNITTDLEWAMTSFKWSIDEFVQIFINMINFTKYYLRIA